MCASATPRRRVSSAGTTAAALTPNDSWTTEHRASVPNVATSRYGHLLRSPSGGLAATTTRSSTTGTTAARAASAAASPYSSPAKAAPRRVSSSPNAPRQRRWSTNLWMPRRRGRRRPCCCHLAEESRTKGRRTKGAKLDEYCEASADGLLRHALTDQSHQSFEQMLDTLELAALYLWLGRNGEEAQAKARHAAPAAGGAALDAAWGVASLQRPWVKLPPKAE